VDRPCVVHPLVSAVGYPDGVRIPHAVFASGYPNHAGWNMGWTEGVESRGFECVPVCAKVFIPGVPYTGNGGFRSLGSDTCSFVKVGWDRIVAGGCIDDQRGC
jgi:hypothetical protein